MNFLRIASNIDTIPLLLAVRQLPQIWGRSFRTSFPNSPHREVLDAILRVQVPEKSADHRECFFTPLWACLPHARPLVFGLMARVDGERLGRILLTWMLPGTTIHPHRDIGPKESGHYDSESYWQRYHLPLEANPQCDFVCGEEGEEEHCVMEPGSCYWFNSALMHRCTNQGQTDRIHLIVDIKSSQMGG